MRLKLFTKHIKKSRNDFSVAFLSVAVVGSMGLIGCQSSQDTSEASDNTDDEQVQTVAEPPPALTPSTDALAAIIEFQPQYVKAMLTMQQDSPKETDTEVDDALTTDNTTASDDENSSDSVSDSVLSSDNSNPSGTTNQKNSQKNVVAAESHAIETPKADVSKKDMNQSEAEFNHEEDKKAKVNEDLEANKIDSIHDHQITEELSDSLSELPLATIQIPPPQVLGADEHRARYQKAMNALYLADSVPIPATEMDTLLGIALNIPDVFRNDELAKRLVLKSPALARLVKQYQIWEYIETQQSAELEALHEANRKEQEKQAKEFEKLMTEFDATIKGYDEQIAKYEEMLKEFE